MQAEDILYEDNHLIIVNKKSGEIVQTDETGDTPMVEDIKQYIKVRDHKPGKVFLGIVHRLDRPTTGAIIFAKTSKGLERMNLMFHNREVTKVYWALTEAAPELEEGIMEEYLWKNKEKNKSYVFQRQTKEAKFAKLKYKTIGKLAHYYLIEVKLFTGRSHQIRAQLSTRGAIIRGDLKYGAKRPNKDKGISLHARYLSFIHPVKKERIVVEAPVPDERIWYDAENFYQKKMEEEDIHHLNLPFVLSV